MKSNSLLLTVKAIEVFGLEALATSDFYIPPYKIKSNEFMLIVCNSTYDDKYIEKGNEIIYD